MAVNIGPKIGIEGEAEYRKELKGIIQETKTLAAETDEAAAAFKNADDKEKAAADVTEKLNKQIEAQRKLVKKLEEAVRLSTEKTGENSQETLKWKEQLAKARTGLANLEAKTKDTTGDVKDLTTAEEKASEKTSIFGDVLKGNLASAAIQQGLKLTAKIVKKLGEFFIEAVKDAAEYADEISTLSKTTGLGTDTLQEYKYMAELLDVDLETITSSITKMEKAMSSGTQAFEDLGVATRDENGELRDANTVFEETLSALSKIENPVERDTKAMEIFGKSAKELNPLIETSAEDLNALRQEAHDVGAVLDKETLGTLNDVKDGFDRVGLTWDALKKKLGAKLGAAILPDLEKIVKAFQQFADDGNAGALIDAIFDAAENFVKKLPGLLDKAEAQLPKLERKILSRAAKFIQKDLPEAIKKRLPSAAKAIGSMLGNIFANLPGLIKAGNELAKGILEGLVQSIPALAKGFVEGFKNSGISSAAQSLIDDFDKVKEKIEEIPGALDRIDESLGEIKGKEKEAGAWLDIIDKIQKKTHPTAGDTQTLAHAVDRLKELYPELGEVIDAESGKWQINTDTIRKNIEAISDRYRAEAYFAAAGDTLQDVARLELEWERVREARDKASAKKTAAEEEAAQTYQLIQALSDLDLAYSRGEISASELQKKMQELVPDATLDDVYDLRQYMFDLNDAWEEQKQAVKDADAVYRSANDTFVQTDRKLQELQKDAEWFYTRGSSYMQSYATKAAQTTPAATAEIKKQAKRIEDEYAQIPKQVEKAGYDTGVALVRGGARGIRAAEDEMIAAAQSAIEKAIGAMKRTAMISSPSKVTENLIGKNLALGVIKGWDDVMDPAKLSTAFSLTPAFDAMTSSVTSNTTNTTNLGGVSVNVYAAEGMDINALTDAIMIKMQKAVNNRKAVFA